jgi:Fe-S-cluster containining protein
MPADWDLVQIVDAALAEATRKSGSWLECRLGCTECCMGPFPITQLDALRLRDGLADLEARDPARGARVRDRARESVARLSPEFPGDPATGVLDEGQAAEERFATLADNEPCPVLDPETGACDLYAARPITCRAFGPALHHDSQDVGVCELCYRGASDEEIAACAVEMDSDRLEDALLGELEAATGARGQTIVAFALATATATAPRPPAGPPPPGASSR